MTIAFVFPGQGSQSVGMLADLIAAEPVVASTFDEAGDALGWNLGQIVQDGPEAELNQTAVTQPAILTASIAIWRLWVERGGTLPAAVAGHSLGEYSALVAAGALEFSDAVRLVNQRGQFMQAAVPAGEGLMAAILGLDDAAIEAACAEIDGAAPANYNAPGQVVLAGRKAAVEAAIEACSAAGARRATALAMSVPSHCDLMMPAAEQLAELLAQTTVNVPSIPVYRNVDAELSGDPDEIREALRAQLFSPVRWTACVQALISGGADRMVECGPGKVLAGLVKRIDRGTPVAATDSPEALAAAIEDLK